VNPTLASSRSETVAPLRARLREPAWRRYGYVLTAGKAAGTVVTFVAMLIATKALHGDTYTGPSLARSLVTTLWMLLLALPVFGLQALAAMLDARSPRSDETARVVGECIADVFVCGVLFYAWGIAFMLSLGTPFLGTRYFFAPGTPATVTTIGTAFLLFWLFQFAFADTSATIRKAVVDVFANPARRPRDPGAGGGRPALGAEDSYRAEAR
jgi:Amt family ammonium transporter